jgi:outer membrane protein assembly factor BamB
MQHPTLCLAAVALAVACATPVASATDWPMFHGGPDLTGLTPDNGPDAPVLRWQPIDTGNAIKASPVVVNGMLYVGNVAGDFYAVEAASGQIVWTKALDGEIHSTAAIHDGVAYVMDETGKLHGLSVSDGTELSNWPKGTGNGDWDWGSPAVHNGDVFIASSTGWVRSYETGSGAQNWSAYVGGQPDCMISVGNDTVFAGTHNFDSSSPTLVALDEATGSQLWSYQYSAHHGGVYGMVNCNGAAVADADGEPGPEVYFGVHNWDGVGNQAVCLDADTGSELWTASIGGNSTSTPAVHEGKVFIGSDDNHLYCLDAQTGAELWKYLTGDDVWASPVIAGGKVYFGSLDHTVYCLDEDTGTSLWSYYTGSNSRLVGSGAVVDGVYYTGDEGGKIYAFIPEPTVLALLVTGTTALLRRRL